MASLEAVFAYIQQQQERSLARLFEYLRMPSISAHGLGIQENAHYLQQLLQQMGFEAQIMPTAGWPMVLARRHPHPHKPTLLLYGHYDVQPPDPLERWESPPFEPTLRNGRIYARGAGDNKGQHFAQLLALESWLQTAGELPINVTVLLEGEEEIGSPHAAAFIEQHRQLLACDLVVTADGPVHDSGQSCIVFGVRGVVNFELRARGAKHDLHSGNWGGVAPNPLWDLVHLLSTLKTPQGHIAIQGFYDAVIPPTPAEQEAMAQLPLDLEALRQEPGLERLDAPTHRPYFERLMFWPTLTLNGFHGGYGGPGSKTVLPCEAVVKGDIRLVEAMTIAQVKQQFEQHLHQHGPNIELRWGHGMEPSKTPLESPYTPRLVQAIQEAQGRKPLLIPSAGGSLPDYVFTKILGVPAFGIPYANPDEANHAPNENLELWRFYQGIRTGAALLNALQN